MCSTSPLRSGMSTEIPADNVDTWEWRSVRQDCCAELLGLASNLPLCMVQHFNITMYTTIYQTAITRRGTRTAGQDGRAELWKVNQMRLLILGKGSVSDKTHNSSMIPAWMMRKVIWEWKDKGSFTLCIYSGETEAVLGNFFFNISCNVFGLKSYESAQPVEKKMKNT